MNRLWCAPHIHLAAVGLDIVILDVAGDEYHCLLDAAAKLRTRSDGSLEVPDEAWAADLQSAGIAVTTPPRVARSSPIAPSREMPDPPAPNTGDLIRTAAAWMTASLIFRRKTFAELLDHCRLPPDDAHAADLSRLDGMVGAARKVRPWMPFEGQCLKRAFQLRFVLATRGIRTDWIFGVRTWPFSAHCWLQIDDLVVGDRLSRVKRYTPIMRA